MRNPSILIAGAIAAASLGLAGCDVQKTADGHVQAPKYEVTKKQEGDVKLPKYDVTPPKVDVNTAEKKVTVPDVDVHREEKTVKVPEVNVTTGKERRQQGDASTMGNK